MSSSQDEAASAAPVRSRELSEQEVPGNELEEPADDSSDSESLPEDQPQQQQASQSQLQQQQQPDDSSSPFTRIDPPGYEAFSAWIARQNEMDYPSSHLEVGFLNNESAVRKFMGPKNDDLHNELRQRRKENMDANLKSRGAQSETVSYKTVDTPLWHNKTLDIGLEEDKHESILTSIRFFFTCKKARAKHRNPVRKRIAQTRFVTRTVLFVIGFLMSVVGFGVSEFSDRLLEWKIGYILDINVDAWGFCLFFLFNFLFAFISFLPTAYRPVSAGSGIAEAKAVLNGILVPQCTELITAACKFISVIFSSAASLPVGLEGPMIFMGLTLGENSQRFVPEAFPTIHWDNARRDLAAVGTACGVTSAFYSPIGGVLFAMEEGSSFWSTRLTWQCFAADCVTAFFSFIWVQLLDLNHNEPFDVENMIKFNGIGRQLNTGQFQPSFHAWDYFVFALMGIVGGVVGACWCEANRSLAVIRSKLNMNIYWKLVEVLLLTFAMSALVWWTPKVYVVCGPLDNVLAKPKHFRQFGCPEGKYNHLATLLLNPPGSTGINLLFWEPSNVFTAVSCVIAGTIYLMMLLLLFGTSMGMGIFIPLLYVGACFGRALGVWWGFEVATYAIVGSAGMLAGVVRVLISLTAIMMETTGLTYFVTPFMVVTLFAKVFGKAIFARDGIYDIILDLKGVPFLEEEAPDSVLHQGLKAEDILTSPLLTLDPVTRVGDLLENIKAPGCQDFAVVDRTRGGTLGVISRKEILILLQHKGLFCVIGDDDNATPKALKYKFFLNSHERAPSINVIENSLSEEDREMVVDLTPYVHIAHPSFDRNGSAERAYEMFRTMGLRHLLVTGHSGEPIGSITRDDLILLDEIGVDEKRISEHRESVNIYKYMH